MSKNQFRVIIVSSLLLAVIGGAYDYLWPDPVAEKALEYIFENEPELDGLPLLFVVVFGFIAAILAIASFVGLLLYKPWSRSLYLAGFVIAFGLYPFMGATVYSAVSQIFYDLSMVMSGVVLALIYYSPIAVHYERKI